MPPLLAFSVDFVKAFQVVKVVHKPHIFVVVNNCLWTWYLFLWPVFLPSLNVALSCGVFHRWENVHTSAVLPLHAHNIVIADCPIILPPFQCFIRAQVFWHLFTGHIYSSASKNSFRFQKFVQIVWWEIVVHENLVISSIQIFTQIFYNPFAKVSFHQLIHFTSIYLKLAHKPTLVTPHPYFISAFYWFLWHVLPQRTTSLEFDHGFVNGLVFRRTKNRQKSFC